jgi:hypothetical protein
MGWEYYDELYVDNNMKEMVVAHFNLQIFFFFVGCVTMIKAVQCRKLECTVARRAVAMQRPCDR